MGLLGNVDQSIQQLQAQQDLMKGMMEQTFDRKLVFMKHDYQRISYKMDETLFYLLQKMQEVDKGSDPVSFIDSLKMTNLAKDISKVSRKSV